MPHFTFQNQKLTKTEKKNKQIDSNPLSLLLVFNYMI